MEGRLKSEAVAARRVNIDREYRKIDQVQKKDTDRAHGEVRMSSRAVDVTNRGRDLSSGIRVDTAELSQTGACSEHEI